MSGPENGAVLRARPTSRDAEVRRAGIVALANSCMEWAGCEIAEEKWVEILSKCHLGGNGYDIARELDDRHYFAGVDAELVEILDMASSCIWTAERNAVQAWVAETKPEPALTEGRRVTYVGEPATIGGFDRDMARYLVVLDTEKEKFAHGGGICVPYESELLSALTERAKGGEG